MTRATTPATADVQLHAPTMVMRAHTGNGGNACNERGNTWHLRVTPKIISLLRRPLPLILSLHVPVSVGHIDGHIVGHIDGHIDEFHNFIQSYRPTIGLSEYRPIPFQSRFSHAY